MNSLFSKINGKSIFLLDAAGAFTSAIFLYVIMNNQLLFGLNKNTTKNLLIGAIGLMIFSSMSYLLSKENNWRSFLKAIYLFNILYIIVTYILIFIHYKSLTWMGVTYFILEGIVVLIIVKYEIDLAHNSSLTI